MRRNAAKSTEKREVKNLTEFVHTANSLRQRLWDKESEDPWEPLVSGAAKGRMETDAATIPSESPLAPKAA